MPTDSCAGAIASAVRSRGAPLVLVASSALASSHSEAASASSLSAVRSLAALRSTATWRSIALSSIAIFNSRFTFRHGGPGRVLAAVCHIAGRSAAGGRATVPSPALPGPAACAARLLRSGLEQHCHRPVVGEFDTHVCTEPAGRHGRAEGTQLFGERL